MIEVHNASCRVSEYNGKTSCEFNFDYYPEVIGENKYHLLLKSVNVFNKIVEKYGLFGLNPSKNYEKYNSLIHNFVKDHINNWYNYAKKDNSILCEDRLYINIFNKKGYLVNVYKIELLETKFIAYTDKCTREISITDSTNLMDYYNLFDKGEMNNGKPNSYD